MAGVCALAAVAMPTTANAVPTTAQASGLGKRTLKLGMRGNDVRAAQGYLDAVGYPATETGRYDRITRIRVYQFEKDTGRRPNGVLDTEDAKALIRIATAPLTASGAGGLSPDQARPKASAPLQLTNSKKAKVLSDGTAAAPASAPAEVKAIIASGNEIAKLPYKWGGGHGSWVDTGYDCSGSTTYALRTTFRKGKSPTFGYSDWQLPGTGTWVTTYASSSHVYLVVAGLRFDTSGLHENGSRWTNTPRSGDGFTPRHPAGF
jgi:cell wall-associated NlpC family hydrolase